MVAAVWFDNVSGSLTNTLSASTAGATQTMTSEGLRLMGTVTNTVTRAKVTLDPFAVNGTPELVYVTAHVAGSNTATITRIAGQPLRQHLASTTWLHGPTAEDFNEFQAQLNTFTYQSQQVATSGGTTSGTTALTVATLNIASQVSAYQLECAATWVGTATTNLDGFDLSIKVAGVSKASVQQQAETNGDLIAFNIPTSTLVNVSASTATTVLLQITRINGTGSIHEHQSGLLTARMSFFL